MFSIISLGCSLRRPENYWTPSFKICFWTVYMTSYWDLPSHHIQQYSSLTGPPNSFPTHPLQSHISPLLAAALDSSSQKNQFLNLIYLFCCSSLKIHFSQKPFSHSTSFLHRCSHVRSFKNYVKMVTYGCILEPSASKPIQVFTQTMVEVELHLKQHNFTMVFEHKQKIIFLNYLTHFLKDTISSISTNPTSLIQFKNQLRVRQCSFPSAPHGLYIQQLCRKSHK